MQDFDFIYDNISLKSLGYRVCEFDSRSSIYTATTDSQRTFENTSMYGGNYFPFILATYNDRLEFTFSICKSSCDPHRKAPFTLADIRALKRWLNRPEPHKFKIICKEYADYYFEGSFNVQELFFGNLRVGLELTFVSNRPYGLHEPVLYVSDLTPSQPLFITDLSDEIGSIYPDITLTCNETGDLTLTNSFDSCETIVKRCTTGETLHFSPALHLSSSSLAHKIQEDFNYTFLRISNSMYCRTNTITSTLPCTIRLSYSPAAKVVI